MTDAFASIDDELQAIFEVIQSSLLLKFQQEGTEGEESVGCVLMSQEHRERLAQELTNYISLFIVKMNFKSDAQAVVDSQGKARDVSQRIFSSATGFQALIQVVQCGRQIFDTNLEALISSQH